MTDHHQSVTPKRIQMRRDRPWRQDNPDAVIVARPTRWGNPFTMKDCREAGYSGTDAAIALRCVEAFRVWLGPHWRNNWTGPESEAARNSILSHIDDLRGRDLACWCKLCVRHQDGLPLGETCADCAPCHADVLLKLANR